MKRLLLLILIITATAIAHATDQVYVVAVGINKYQNVNSLKLSETDAHDFSSMISQYNNTHVTILTGPRATRQNIISAMKRCYRSATASDVVMLYFSGHGIPGALCGYDVSSKGRGGLTYTDISAVMKSCPAKRKIIITDACHSGTGRLRAHSSSSDSNTSSTIKNANIILFMSSRDKEYSMEFTSMKNSIFTHYLMRGLAGAADRNSDRQITAREIFDYVSRNVRSDTNDGQHPVMWGNFDENFIFMTY